MEEQTSNATQTNDGEPTFEESFQMLYADAPKPIQKFLLEKNYEEIASSLAHTYRLNIDQTGILSQKLVFLLLGAQSPHEFSESLVRDSGLTEDVSTQITNDINKLVFIPLREQIQREGVSGLNNQVQNAVSSNQENTDSGAHEQPSREVAAATYTHMPSPTPPIPLHVPSPSSSPIVKEYSVDPYKESLE